jgi:hypothetical protein
MTLRLLDAFSGAGGDGPRTQQGAAHRQLRRSAVKNIEDGELGNCSERMTA